MKSAFICVHLRFVIVQKTRKNLKDSTLIEGSGSIRFFQICEACFKKMVLLGSGEVTEEVMFNLV